MDRPKIGLALGGGVARGWAHIGVLRALQAADIEADIICGTSIGAVVGGCFLAGKLDELEAWARSLTRLKIMSYLDFHVRMPSLIGGERLIRELEGHLGPVAIENLPRRFATVATDLTTGHEVWLHEGPLVEAIRASFSLPGIFPPVLIRNRWLVDGALVNPVPVSLCVAQGATLVIAVNLNADLIGKARASGGDFQASFDILEAIEETQPAGVTGLVKRLFRRQPATPSMFGVMTSSLNIVLDRITRSRLAGDPPDVHIAPKLGHIGIMEFDRAAEMIDVGIRATEAALPEIQAAMDALGMRQNGGNGEAESAELLTPPAPSRTT